MVRSALGPVVRLAVALAVLAAAPGAAEAQNAAAATPDPLVEYLQRCGP
ncbi:MAG: hypothetical protein HY906_16290 [Deltaproteobacteria bacterium]|nr:hypothetical protein [Deltaproteobacteria bacterium]